MDQITPSIKPWLPSLILIFCLSGCISGTPTRTNPNPGDPVASAPIFCEGDNWVKRRYYPEYRKNVSVKSTVSKVYEDGRFEVHELAEDIKLNRVDLYNKSAQKIKTTNLNSGKSKNIPPVKGFLDFPLFVGKEWGATNRTRSIGGDFLTYNSKFKVLAYSEINTKVGKLFVYKIRRRSTTSSSYSSDLYESFAYYSPKIKTPVKYVSSSMKIPNTIISASEVNQCSRSDNRDVILLSKTDANKKNNSGPTALNDPVTVSNSKNVTKQDDKATFVVKETAPSLPKTNQYSKDWAVVIGVAEYKYSYEKSGLTNLMFADDDAEDFAKVLQDKGWNKSHIKLLINEQATQRNIIIALKSWLTKAGSNDKVILFWAGHGFPDPDDQEKVYLSTYDTNIKIPATGYRMDEVQRALEELSAKNVILFADTCHAGKLITRGERSISIVPKLSKMQREKKIPKGWIYMVGADTDRQAIEHSSWSNGAFTHSLIKGLNGDADGFQSAGAVDGIVTMGELKDYMKSKMPEETYKVLGVAKHPVITTSTGDPEIWNLSINQR